MQKILFLIWINLLAFCCRAQGLSWVGGEELFLSRSVVEEPVGDEWKEVNLDRRITHAQPMTGIAVWPWKARDIHSSYGQCIQLEFNYFEPSEIVKGCNADGMGDRHTQNQQHQEYQHHNGNIFHDLSPIVVEGGGETFIIRQSWAASADQSAY